MKKLKGKHISLRALEPEDLLFLYDNENNEDYWEVSSTQAPFSKYLLKKYLDNVHLDIYETKQLRLVVESNQSFTPVGLIDLFDFDPQHKRAGVGILIDKKHRSKGYASEALRLLISYAFHYLNVHQLYANITTDNTQSIHLFEKMNFSFIGVKKEWILSGGTYKDEAMYQLLFKLEGANAK